MKKILSIFVVLMFLLSGVAYAQDDATTTSAETEETTEEIIAYGEGNNATDLADNSGITAVADEVETTTEAPVPTLYETEANSEEYTGLDQAWDRIRLAFTFQEEKKLEIMNKISERREKHHEFLLAKGKTEQAERFEEKTSVLRKNYDDWKAKRSDKLAQFEKRVADTKENISEKRMEKTTERADKVEKRVEEQSEKLDKRAAAVDTRLTNREDAMEKRSQAKDSDEESEDAVDSMNETTESDEAVS